MGASWDPPYNWWCIFIFSRGLKGQESELRIGGVGNIDSFDTEAPAL